MKNKSILYNYVSNLRLKYTNNMPQINIWFYLYEYELQLFNNKR